MLTEFTGIHHRPGPAANSAFPVRTRAMAERFQQQCLQRLDVEPARAPRPIQHSDPADAETNLDPAVSAIEEWHAARHAYWTHQLEIVHLWNTIPDWVRNWCGVYAGRTETADGSAVPILARNEKTLKDCYDRRVRDSASPEATQRIEGRRREALAELRLALAAEKGAYRAAGLPFERDNEDEYWRGFRARITRAIASVESTPARSARGIEARCRHAVELIDEMPNDDSDDESMRHLRSVIMRIAQDVADISED